MTDDLTKRAQAVLALAEKVDSFEAERNRMFGTGFAHSLTWEKRAAAADSALSDSARESASIIAAYMQRDAEQRAEIERLRHTLKSLADEFVRVFPIYYYAEPWAHDQNMVLKSARSVLGHEKKESTHD